MNNKNNYILILTGLIVVGTIILCVINNSKDQIEYIELNTNETYLMSTGKCSNSNNFHYENSNEDIVSVDSNGKIYALKSGNARIVSRNNNNDICLIYEIKINDVEIKNTEENILINDIIISNIVLEENEVKILDYQLLPENTNEGVILISSDENIAIVSGNQIKGINNGETTLIIRSNSGLVSKTINVKVNNKKNITEEVVPNKSESHIELSKLNDGIKINSTYKLSYTGDILKNDSIIYKSLDSTIATVDNMGSVKGLKLGTTTIEAYINGVKQSSIDIKIIPNVDKININAKNPYPYQTEILLRHCETCNSGMPMQDFDIENLGTNNEIYYFSVPYNIGIYETYNGITLTSELKRELTVGTVQKIAKKDLKTWSNVQTMYMVNTGQGQWVVKEPNNDYLWFAHNSGVVCSGKNCNYDVATNIHTCTNPPTGCVWWGAINANVARYKFEVTRYEKTAVPLKSYNYGKTSQSNMNAWLTVDWNNNLAAVIVNSTKLPGYNVYVYDANMLINGTQKLLYSFKLDNNPDSAVYQVQGFALSGGYLYRLRSYRKVDNNKTILYPYIEQYNIYGNLISTKKVTTGYENKRFEPQGMKIYNNTIYFGFRYVPNCIINTENDECTLSKTNLYKNAIYYLK